MQGPLSDPASSTKADLTFQACLWPGLCKDVNFQSALAKASSKGQVRSDSKATLIPKPVFLSHFSPLKGTNLELNITKLLNGFCSQRPLTVQGPQSGGVPGKSQDLTCGFPRHWPSSGYPMANGNTLYSTQALGCMCVLVGRDVGYGWGATSSPLNLLRQNGRSIR